MIIFIYFFFSIIILFFPTFFIMIVTGSLFESECITCARYEKIEILSGYFFFFKNILGKKLLMKD